MDHLLYGCAYYDEYMPYERLGKILVKPFIRPIMMSICRMNGLTRILP